MPQVVPEISRYEGLMSVSNVFQAREKFTDLGALADDTW
jgi:hypothetical protein